MKTWSNKQYLCSSYTKQETEKLMIATEIQRGSIYRSHGTNTKSVENVTIKSNISKVNAVNQQGKTTPQRRLSDTKKCIRDINRVLKFRVANKVYESNSCCDKWSSSFKNHANSYKRISRVLSYMYIPTVKWLGPLECFVFIYLCWRVELK